MFDSISVDLSTFDWQAVGALAAVITVLLTAILLAGVFFGYRNLREAVRTRDASLFTWAILRMEELKPHLAVLRSALGSDSSKDAEGNSQSRHLEIEASAHRVTVELQRLAYLANSGLISEIHLREMWGPTFVEAWELLEEWVKNKRRENGEPIELEKGAFSRKDFERFAVMCKKHYG